MTNVTQNSSELSLEEVGQLLKPVELVPMRENPLVSILTTNYNYARFIGDAIECAQKQTYANWEMIICDDGSTDNSCELVGDYMRRDPRVRLVRKQNGGQVSATNAAYRVSRGEIVSFLDADDRLLPEKVAMVVRAFQSHPDSGFVGHRQFCVDAAGRRNGMVPAFIDPPSGWFGPSIVRHGPHLYGMAISSAQCLRREIGDLIFPVSESFRTGPDAAIISLAPLMTRIVGIPAPLTEYRHHESNMISRSGSQVSDNRARQLESVHMETAYAAWEAARNYLQKVNPVLARAYPAFGQSQGALVTAYMQARLRSWGGTLTAYRDMVRAAGFEKLPLAGRWFWRISIVLPGPVLRYAFHRGRLKQLFSKAMETRRRYLAARALTRVGGGSILQRRGKKNSV